MDAFSPTHNLDRLPEHRLRPALDLRRRDRRTLAEAILHRAACLPPEDHTLLRAIYAEGLTAAEAAKLRREDPRATRRRIRALINRLRTPLFIHTLHHHAAWPPLRRQIATICILHDHSIREAAQRTGLSIHTVRKQLHAIHALHDDALRETPGTTNSIHNRSRQPAHPHRTPEWRA